MANQLNPHTLGTVFALRYREKVTDSDPVEWIDLTAVPVTLCLDNGSTRVTLRYLNGGSDGVAEDSGTAVKFSQPPTWAALSAGLWDVRYATGAHATAQQMTFYGTLEVIQPTAGPLPVAEGA